jgi:hypothetical protein
MVGFLYVGGTRPPITLDCHSSVRLVNDVQQVCIVLSEPRVFFLGRRVGLDGLPPRMFMTLREDP